MDDKWHRVKRFLRKNWLEILFVLPLIIFILGFTIRPILNTFVMGFQESPGIWSFENYKYVFNRPSFYKAIKNTLTFSAIALTIQFSLGFAIALFLKQNFLGKGVARAFVLLPLGVPTLVSGVAMLYIFSSSGYLNEIVYRLGISNAPINWTGEFWRSLFIVAIADSWKVMPMVVLLMLSGLESIPADLYEAANIDGANTVQKFRYITLPQLKATITMTVLMRVVDLLKCFEMPQVLLGKGTPFLGTLAYDEYKYGNNGYSAVISTVLLLIIIVVVCIYMNLFEKERGVKHRES